MKRVWILSQCALFPIIQVLKAPYVKFYTLLKAQTLSSECEARPEVGFTRYHLAMDVVLCVLLTFLMPYMISSGEREFFHSIL